jgi:hypothetical protein
MDRRRRAGSALAALVALALPGSAVGLSLEVTLEGKVTEVDPDLASQVKQPVASWMGVMRPPADRRGSPDAGGAGQGRE